MKLAVGGMIASGKSTLVQSLAEELDLEAMDEFDEDDEVFHTLLKWLYDGVEDVEMLLQVYFLHKHWKTQKKFKDVVVDRHIIEHWLFAQTNLKKFPEILNMYNGVFHAYMNDVTHPDLYIILDMNWDTFKARIFARGREQEMANFDENKQYFFTLMENYTKKLIAQCNIYDIPYRVIDVNGKDKDTVLMEAIAIVENFKEGK